MIQAIRRRFSILKAVAIVTYKEWSVYRTHSMVSIIVGPVYFLVQYCIWTAVYGDQATMGGMALSEMIRYFGATALIGYLTMDFADWNLSMLIRTGKFLTFSLRPVHHRFFALSQKIGHRFLGFWVEFIPCLFIFVVFFGVDMRPAHWLWMILSVIFAFLMNFYVNYCLGMLSFWLVQANGIRGAFSLLSSVFSGAIVPLVLFPQWLQWLQFFLPFQYIAYVPARVFSGSYTLGGISMELWQIVSIQGVAVVVFFLLSEVMYRAAMKQFTAVGA